MSSDKIKRKRLILLRHAKSSWEGNVDDHERPLADRGRKAAPVMGAYLAKARIVPDFAIVSTARRTQETWARVSRALKSVVKGKNSREIYEAPAETILDVIHTVDADVGTLIVVGHNPGLEELAKLLMKDTGGEPGERLRTKFPTAAIAVMSFDVKSWDEVVAGTGSLDRFVTPKSIG